MKIWLSTNQYTLQGQGKTTHFIECIVPVCFQGSLEVNGFGIKERLLPNLLL